MLTVCSHERAASAAFLSYWPWVAATAEPVARAMVNSRAVARDLRIDGFLQCVAPAARRTSCFTVNAVAIARRSAWVATDGGRLGAPGWCAACAGEYGMWMNPPRTAGTFRNACIRP